MDFWGSWLSCFITYLLACFKTAWRGIKTDQKSPFLLLPPEILLEIFKYLDYHALVDVRQVWSIPLQTSRILHCSLVDLQNTLRNDEL